MGVKRSRETETPGGNTETNAKKQKRGFAVGPNHLPEGTYRRRIQKIKRNLIDKAKVRKEYAKLKQRQQLEQPSEAGFGGHAQSGMHPERAFMIENARNTENEPKEGANTADSVEPEDPISSNQNSARLKAQETQRETRHWQKPSPFSKEQAEAMKRQKDIETRREAKMEAMRQKEHKQEERERFRKAMAKARTGGKNGQRKLGRESKVLLERVQRLVGR